MDKRHLQWAHDKHHPNHNAPLNKIVKGIYYTQNSLYIDLDHITLPDWFLITAEKYPSLKQELIVYPNYLRAGPSTNYTPPAWIHEKDKAPEGSRLYSFVSGNFYDDTVALPLLALVDTEHFYPTLKYIKAPPKYQSERSLKDIIANENIYLSLLPRLVDSQIVAEYEEELAWNY